MRECKYIVLVSIQPAQVTSFLFKYRLTFPTVFIVYLTIDLMILGKKYGLSSPPCMCVCDHHVLPSYIGVIVLVQYVDRFGLSCSSDDLLLNTFETPTKFCTASGMYRLSHFSNSVS